MSELFGGGGEGEGEGEGEGGRAKDFYRLFRFFCLSLLAPSFLCSDGTRVNTSGGRRPVSQVSVAAGGRQGGKEAVSLCFASPPLSLASSAAYYSI